MSKEPTRLVKIRLPVALIEALGVMGRSKDVDRQRADLITASLGQRYSVSRKGQQGIAKTGGKMGDEKSKQRSGTQIRDQVLKNAMVVLEGKFGGKGAQMPKAPKSTISFPRQLVKGMITQAELQELLAIRRYFLEAQEMYRSKRDELARRMIGGQTVEDGDCFADMKVVRRFVFR